MENAPLTKRGGDTGNMRSLADRVEEYKGSSLKKKLLYASLACNLVAFLALFAVAWGGNNVVGEESAGGESFTSAPESVAADLAGHDDFKKDSTLRLFFAKTHKTGSTVMFSIFARYAWEHNATAASPRGKRSTMYSVEQYLDKSLIKPDGPYQMSFYHGIFGFKDNEHDKDVLRAIYGDDTKPFTVTIMRDPATMIPSAMYFFFSKLIIPNDFPGSFEKVKTMLTPFFNSPGKVHFTRQEAKYHFLRDGMAYDLGLLADDESTMPRAFAYTNITEEFMQKKLQQLDDWLDFAIINEHLDESLILLRAELANRGYNTRLEDWLYVTQNVGKRHQKAQKGEAEKKLEDEIRDWAKFDTMIYRHFFKRFQERVGEYGRDKLDKDVEEFRALQKKVLRSCAIHANIKETDEDGLPIVIRGGMPKMHGASQLCKDLFTRDTTYITKLRSRQQGST